MKVTKKDIINYVLNGSSTNIAVLSSMLDGLCDDKTNEIVQDVNLEKKHIIPSTISQTINPASDYDGFSTITVDAVTSSIDSNIRPENIREGVTILGVTGAYNPTTPLSSLF